MREQLIQELTRLQDSFLHTDIITYAYMLDDEEIDQLEAHVTFYRDQLNNS